MWLLWEQLVFILSTSAKYIYHAWLNRWFALVSSGLYLVGQQSIPSIDSESEKCLEKMSIDLSIRICHIHYQAYYVPPTPYRFTKLCAAENALRL